MSDAGPAPVAAHLRKLAAHSAVYGAADVFGNALNLLLVPLYTAYLVPADYGTLALLILFGTVAKIVFRLGLDAGFFRIYYVLPDEAARRRLAGSVVLFTALVGGALFALVALAGRPLSRALLGTDALGRFVVLVAADVYVGSLAFVPLSLLRIQERPGLFSGLSSLRHALNVALKVLLLTRGWGVAGVLWSDLAATAAFVLLLLPVLLRHATPALAPALLRPALGFGLPKVPHGVLVQALNLADRKILDLFVTRAELGLYQLGSTLGSGVKFALSAFEPAWQPFVYAQAAGEGGPRVLARVGAWAWAVFVLAALGVATLGRELLVLLTPANPAFRAAAPVVPVIALAYLLHGAFLLGSVGIGISRRARYYPIVTAAAAAVNIAANFALVPRFGILGAAWATVLAYAAMAGLGIGISRRLYPIPYDARPLLAPAIAALALYAVSLLAPVSLGAALAFKLPLVLVAYPLLAWTLGLRRAV